MCLGAGGALHTRPGGWGKCQVLTEPGGGIRSVCSIFCCFFRGEDIICHIMNRSCARPNPSAPRRGGCRRGRRRPPRQTPSRLRAVRTRHPRNGWVTGQSQADSLSSPLTQAGGALPEGFGEGRTIWEDCVKLLLPAPPFPPASRAVTSPPVHHSHPHRRQSPSKVNKQLCRPWLPVRSVPMAPPALRLPPAMPPTPFTPHLGSTWTPLLSCPSQASRPSPCPPLAPTWSLNSPPLTCPRPPPLLKTPRPRPCPWKGEPPRKKTQTACQAQTPCSSA